ncbi:MAG: hypothetical protein IJU41_05970 [Clostridia bacterium]|nr:hypothetical protein [Clostridia bacterium]
MTAGGGQSRAVTEPQREGQRPKVAGGVKKQKIYTMPRLFALFITPSPRKSRPHAKMPRPKGTAFFFAFILTICVKWFTIKKDSGGFAFLKRLANLLGQQKPQGI